MFLSESIGKDIRDAAGQVIGRLDDMIASTEEHFPRVNAIVIKTGKTESTAVPWSQIAEFDKRWQLSVSQDEMGRYEPKEDEVPLYKDVVDKQIVDVHNYRVVRVNDIRLLPSDGQLFLVGVDTGMRGLLRRLGIEKFAEKVLKLINRQPQSTIIAWADVETFEKEAGRLRLSVPLDELSKLHPADLAKIVNELDPAQRTEVFETLDLETAAQTLPEAHPDVQADIIESLNDERAADILEEMEPDEAADVLQDLSPDRRQDLLEEMEDEEAEDVKELLEYDEETAGGLMTNEFVSVTRQMTAQETIDLLRELEPDTETIYYVYVVDEDGGLVGVISLRDLIVARPDVKVEQFMVKNVISVRVDGTVEEVAKTMGDYNLLALPVVDDGGRLEGIITVDDALQRILPEDWRRRVPKVWSG